MIISCSACGTRYDLKPDQIGPKGRMVKCVKCNHEWLQPPLEQIKTSVDLTVAPPVPPKNPLTLKSIKEDVKAEVKKRKQSIMNMAAYLFMILFVVLASIAVYQRIVLYKLKNQGHIVQAELPMTSTGLAIQNVERTFQEEGGIGILVFKGQVRNKNALPVKIPEVRVSLYNKMGVELDYWPALLDRAVLEEDEVANWTCRFFNPPADQITEFRITFSDDVAAQVENNAAQEEEDDAADQ